MRKWIIGLAAAGILGIGACSGEEAAPESGGQEPAEETEVKDEAASGEVEKSGNAGSREMIDPAFMVEMGDVEGWMKTGPGPYGGDQYDEEAVRAEIGQWPEGLDPEDYFRAIVSLTSADYRPYQEILETTEIDYGELTDTPDAESGEEIPADAPPLNVQILLDASGSMAGQMEGRSKMDLAKEAITGFAGSLPDNANVSLRIYGHAGSNQPDGKELSCSTTEEVYALDSYDAASFRKALDTVAPTGYTPIGLAMEEAAADLKQHGDGAQNVVYVVSDGKETCGGDAVAAAKSMQQEGIRAVVNIIGFDIAEEERQSLESIAEAGGGEYLRADTAEELKNTFSEERTALINDWFDWVNENINSTYDQSTDYALDAYDKETEAKLLLYDEQTRQKLLAYDLEGQMEGVESSDIIDMISERTGLMLDHVQEGFQAIRDEASEEGNKIREDIREKGNDEQEKLRENDTD
ncbi:Mg-chelatase subunit ChlD [Bhargavaea cecembensis DSE10]|uniref:Mg-chelatase subunit ChlD n=1 Tax=Bhargavaea cecembensis DSE10 TaxID=1235279 RepID=M7NXK7_9BACL|nr:VWA domain-containing protein [Bhargavaea cecembensis]EMR06390.1 Mg-chelatase subunit ChlD [Bhargavaea cecembensis DSE10]